MVSREFTGQQAKYRREVGEKFNRGGLSKQSKTQLWTGRWLSLVAKPILSQLAISDSELSNHGVNEEFDNEIGDDELCQGRSSHCRWRKAHVMLELHN